MEALLPYPQLSTFFPGQVHSALGPRGRRRWGSPSRHHLRRRRGYEIVGRRRSPAQDLVVGGERLEFDGHMGRRRRLGAEARLQAMCRPGTRLAHFSGGSSEPNHLHRRSQSPAGSRRSGRCGCGRPPAALRHSDTIHSHPDCRAVLILIAAQHVPAVQDVGTALLRRMPRLFFQRDLSKGEEAPQRGDGHRHALAHQKLPQPRSSARVMSGFSSTAARIRPAWASIHPERLSPPIRRGCTSPVRRT